MSDEYPSEIFGNVPLSYENYLHGLRMVRDLGDFNAALERAKKRNHLDEVDMVPDKVRQQNFQR